MGKGYLIDSNAIIGYLDNKIPEHYVAVMNAIIDDTPNISVINKIEVLRFNAPATAYKIIESFIAECHVWDLDDIVVNSTIAICKSHKIKLPDAVIAATALANDFFTLVTRNTNDFKNIKGLSLLNPWAAPDEHQS